ncbi:site-specific integrase [Neisseria wadsworthii]|uniref:site-specific integrase n=1 Tax=Neisseria wadsworthii TaxID=607711 RepID=UPI001F4458C1|nr:site-specific integrase [Neisseria wadsworthii]
MSIYKRNEIWQIDIYAPDGKRIRCSAGTKCEKEAQEFHDKLKHDLWRNKYFAEKPKVLWDEACLRWLDEKRSKKSLIDDETKIRKLSAFRGLYLHHLSKQLIMAEIAKIEGSNATKNRYLAFIQALLNKCVKDWDYLDVVPKLPRYQEAKRRIRWLKPNEAETLIAVLPEYIAVMVIFSLNTGLRKSNVFNLKWTQIDLRRKVAWIHHDQTKSGHALGVALNDASLAVLLKQKGKHPEYVFVNQQCKPVKDIQRQWKKALQVAGIEDFRWHDLRHTWASWLVQSGVSLYAL